MTVTAAAEETRDLFGLKFFAGTFDEAVALLERQLDVPGPPARVVVTPNVDHLVKLDRDASISQVYRDADFVFADGMPVVVASRMLGKPLAERVTGADLFPALCEIASRQRRKVFVLGGRPEEEEVIRRDLGRLYPGADIRVYSPSMAFTPMGAEGDRAVELVNAWRPDIVFCCLGMPKQERWALHNRGRLDAKLVLCVGAALEFALMRVRRAPRPLRAIGLEWAWRLASDPVRLWRRYLVDDPAFVYLLAREWWRLR